jgi:hypothetical protein
MPPALHAQRGDAVGSTIAWRSRARNSARAGPASSHDDADRAQVVRGMRERVLECMTYKAIAKQTIQFRDERPDEAARYGR